MLLYLLLGCAGVALFHIAAQQGRGTPSSAALTPEAARAVLGVSETASEQDIQDAYRRLMQKNHPDQGGSEFLAAQINAARDVLLK